MDDNEGNICPDIYILFQVFSVVNVMAQLRERVNLWIEIKQEDNQYKNDIIQRWR